MDLEWIARRHDQSFVPAREIDDERRPHMPFDEGHVELVARPVVEMHAGDVDLISLQQLERTHARCVDPTCPGLRIASRNSVSEQRQRRIAARNQQSAVAQTFEVRHPGLDRHSIGDFGGDVGGDVGSCACRPIGRHHATVARVPERMGHPTASQPAQCDTDTLRDRVRVGGVLHR